MRKLFRFLSLTLLASLAFEMAEAQFTTGNVVVLQVGDGTTALTSASTPLFLKEYNTATLTQATPVTTVNIPITGAARLAQSGSATSEGQITLSQDSTKIVIAGYDTTTGVASIASSVSANIARAVDTVGNAGVVGKADTTKTAFSGNNIRSAARNSAENYWAVGGNTGVYYMGNLASPAIVYNTAANFRVINAANGKLYFSTASVLSRIMRINSQPASGPATADTMIVLGTGTTPSPYAFAVNAAETIVYVADDRTTGGGIQKWTGSGTTWTLAYTFSVGTATGARGIAVDWSGTNPVIYATTNTSANAGGNLIKITDSNSTAPFQILATAPINAAFRSVVFAPKVACTAPVLSAAITPYTCSSTGAITVSVTGGSTPIGYSYTGPGFYTANTQNISNLQPGTYVLTATTAGGCTTTLTSVVANNATLSATATASGATTFCAGGNVVLSANTGTGYSYQWNNATGSIVNATASTYTVTAAGTYTVTITSGVNCTATSAAVTVTVNPLPAATITASGPTTFCTGSSITLTAPAAAGNTYVWKLNGAAIAGATANTYTANATGSYRVIVTNSNGCMDSTSTGVIANPLPVSTITANGSTNFCTGGSVQLCASVIVSGNAYQWSLNGANIAGATGSCITATASGTYCLSVTNTITGCSSNSCQVVTSGTPPTAIVTPAGPLAICQGSGVVLHTNNASGLTYQWYNGSTAITGATDSIYTAAAAGAYTVTVSAGIGCSATSSTVNITVNPVPVATLGTILPIFCVGDNIPLTATPSGNTYQYYVNGILIPGASTQQYSYPTTAAGNDTFAVVVTNSSGCSDTAFNIVTVNPKPTPVINYSGGVLSTTQSYVSYQWMLNGIAIGNISATQPAYTPAVNGVYNVKVTNSTGCSDTAAIPVLVTGLGVAATPGIRGVQIFPNPASTVLHIDASFVVNVVLRDVQGRVVLQQMAAKNLDISNLAAGIYQITCNDAQGARLGVMSVVKAAH